MQATLRFSKSRMAGKAMIASLVRAVAAAATKKEVNGYSYRGPKFLHHCTSTIK